MAELENMKQSLDWAENILYPIISGVGIVANVFVITILTIWEKAQSNRNVANVFVVNLAVADLLFLVVLPLYMPIWFIDNGWVYGATLCKIFEVIKYVNFRASILFLTLMSIDRYLAIVYTLNSMAYRTRQNAIKTCVAIWLISFLVTIPALLYANILRSTTSYPICRLQFPGFHSNIIEDENEFYDSVGDYALITSEYELDIYNTTLELSVPTPICIDDEHVHSPAFHAWEYSSFVLFFVLPLSVILFCYFEIVRTATQRSIQRSKASSQRQVVVMVAVLVVLFVVCWMPFQIWRLLQLPPGQAVRYANDCLIIESTLTMLAWSNSALNPIFYSISSKRFRSKAISAWKYIRGQDRSALMPMSRAVQTRTSQMTSKRNHLVTISPSSTPSIAVKYSKETEQVSGLPQVNPTYMCDADKQE